MRLELATRLGIRVDTQGFMEIPPAVERLKIDVGLSFSAPHALVWLEQDANLLVIGFEPDPSNIARLRAHLEQVDTSVADRFVLIQSALGAIPGESTFFHTVDPGQSSFRRPKSHPVEKVETVPIETLDRILELVEPTRFKLVDYLKTDCQGFDHQVLLGAQATLVGTAVVTIEAPTNAYERKAGESLANSAQLMRSLGFYWANKPSTLRRILRIFGSPLLRFSPKLVERIQSSQPRTHQQRSIQTLDPTFVNERFREEVRCGQITALQFN